ncbi:transcriptional regulator TbsP [Halogeometricum limi]|uniref:Uncharacterized protein n=1 Tax=Halogeometricum limi TaxID=555875 RepID=A0A1I6IDH7_9EURY|nr:DUF5821 family protein [Halogeometricum limi]SFR64669.1 hypothetical protein SAMN04488124_3075 [Halogeometricum limi]
MHNPAELLSDEIGEIFQWVFEEAGSELYLVNPTADALEQAVESLSTFSGEKPELRVLGTKGVLREVMEDFLIASRTADLLEEGALSLRVLGDASGHKPNLMVSESSVTTVVGADGLLAGLRTNDDEFTADVRSTYETRFEECDSYKLHTPAFSHIEASIEDRLGPDCRTDFVDFVANLQTARGDSDGPDEVTISLLVAARNRELFYDVSRWAEDIGLASKATFSRKKTELEERGLIGTEKVPIDVGRPRLRLVIGDERLRDASVEQLAGVAQSTSS